MKCRILLAMVVHESTPVLELLAGEDEALLVGGNVLGLVDKAFDFVDRVGKVHVDHDAFSGQGLDIYV